MINTYVITTLILLATTGTFYFMIQSLSRKYNKLVEEYNKLEEERE